MFNSGTVVINKATGVTRADKKPQISVAAITAAKISVYNGLTNSLANYLYNNNSDKDAIKAKIITVINQFRSANDISVDEQRWLSATAAAEIARQSMAMDPECATAIGSYAYLSWYSVISNLINNDSLNCYAFSDSILTSLTEKERAIVTGFRAAREKYYEAESKFREYFREVIIQTLKDAMLRHGTMFAQVAPEWYTMLADSIGIPSKERATVKVVPSSQNAEAKLVEDK